MREGVSCAPSYDPFFFFFAACDGHMLEEDRLKMENKYAPPQSAAAWLNVSVDRHQTKTSVLL